MHNRAPDSSPHSWESSHFARWRPPTTRVGVAAVDITPDYPVRLSGFGFRRTESEGVTQRIWAKALAFDGDAGAGRPSRHRRQPRRPAIA